MNRPHPKLGLFGQVYDMRVQKLVISLAMLIFIFSMIIFSLISTVKVDGSGEISFTSEKVIEFIDDAKRSLDEGNATKTLSGLFTAQRILAQLDRNSSSIQESKILIRDAIQAVVNGKKDTALSKLNLIYKQLAIELPSNETTKSITRTANKTPIPELILPNNETSVTAKNKTFSTTRSFENKTPIPELILPNNKTSSTVYNDTGMKYLTYDNRLFGIKIQYPEGWTVRSYNYNKGGNNTVVGFFSPSELTSHVGNISGITGQFVPYFDIFVYQSKNMSLETIIKASVDRLRNHTYSEIVESKPYILNGNLNAHLLVHSATRVGENELYKRIQIYALLNGKVYLLTFSSQEESFSNYLPVIKKMIDSFEILKNVGDKCFNKTKEC